MIKNIPLGVENFIEACQSYYVDKTLIIKDIIDNCLGRPLLITRPRRFGKSLMISMLESFFTNKSDNSKFFNDKKIYNDKNSMNYLNKYPVIHINMKDISAPDYESMLKMTFELISSIYRSFSEILEVNDLFKVEKEKYLNIANNEYNESIYYIESIKFLSLLLFKKYNKKVVILIDEYDTPLENAFQNGFYEEAIDFYKRFYSATLKANDNVLFSFTTGVLQISKESIFSELNNLNVYSNVDNAFVEYFGFTENEVVELMEKYDVKYDLNKLRDYYSGYGNNRINIYNPWSILNYIESEVYESYWTNTGSNITISNLVSSIPNSLEFLNEFVNNKALSFKFNNSISYKDVKNNYETLFSYLVQSGYLVARRIDDTNLYNLFIPNLEIFEVFEREIISRNIDKNILSIAASLRSSLINGNTNDISKILSDYIVSSFSYFDLNEEKDFQNVITGILAVLFNDYIVKSEVNNTRGRCDIMLFPKDKKNVGIIIELKYYKGRIGKKRLEQYSNKALLQIEENKYYVELEKYGCNRILLYSFIFDNNDNYINLKEKER